LLHENGSVSVYYRENIQNKLSLFKNITSKQQSGIDDIFDNLEKSFAYNLFIQSDSIRLSKNSQVFGFSVCPVAQKKFAIILSDGRLLQYELIKKLNYQKYRSNRLNLENNVNSNMYLFDFNITTGLSKDFKLTLTNMTNTIIDIPFIFKVCPPMTKKNFKYWQPLLAMGSSNGYLYVYNLNRNALVKKLLLYNHGVLGIEWYSVNCVLTWSYHVVNSIPNINDASPSSSNQLNRQVMVKNELFLTDLRTGESRSIREGINEESSIVSVKLSIHRQYLVIIFKEQPLEIWDMKNFSLIKKISKKSPIIKVLEWYPLHPDAKKIEQKSSTESTATVVNTSTKDSPTNQQDNSTKTNIIPATHCENFICVDEHGLMYSFTIESNHIKDGSSSKILPQDGLISNVTSMAIKKDLIIFGDMEGNLVKWDVKTKTSKFLNYKREIKKIKFAPGKENLFLLVHLIESLEIIDITNMDTFSSFKFSLQQSKSKVVDCDWCCSDRIVCFFSDNTLKIFDINFKQTPNINTTSDCNPFTQMPSILVSNRTKSLTNESSYILFKNFFYKTIQSIDDFDNFDLTHLKEQIFNSEISLNKLLNDNLLNIIQKAKDLKLNDIQNDKSVLYKKIYSYLLYSLYFNTSHFETNFWSLLLHVLDQDDSFSNLLFKKHSILFKRDLFRLNEYQLFKIYKEKQDPKVLNKNNLLIKYLLLANELDYVFNLLLESEFQSEHYMNDYLK
jgi:hypothetical protein